MDTNSLTMRLLALASHCEGPKAAEIKAIIAQLPVATFSERTAADSEIKRLKQENGDLKQRLAQEVLVNRTNYPPSTPAQPAAKPYPWLKSEVDRPRPTRFDMPPMEIKQEQRSTTSSLGTRDLRLTPPPPPAPRELFPDGSAQRRQGAKRLRSDSTPPPQLTRPRRPECVGCFMIGGACDGRSICGVCRARKYGCEYRECWEGIHCADRSCTRLHPDQWDRQNEEPPRKVKAWVQHNGARSRWE